MNCRKISGCSFNINRTKDKVPSPEEKLSRFDVFLLQEHLLPTCSVNFLRRNRDHIVFSSNTRQTRDMPSGGLACYTRRTLVDLSPVCYQSSEHFLAVRLGDSVLINSYLSHNKKSVQSLSSFAKSCDRLQGPTGGTESLGYSWLLVGDLNYNIHISSSRSETLVNALPATNRIINKDCSFSYIHNSGAVSDLDHCECSPLLHSSYIHVNNEERGYDHLPLNLDISISSRITFSAPPKPKKWTCKRDWDNTNWSLCFSTLAFLLSTISMPYHLLGTGYFVSDARGKLNSSKRNIVSSIKQAEAIAVPLISVRLNTHQTFWKCEPELMKVKNQAQFWLKMWITCGRPSSGQVFSIKERTKLTYKRHLRVVRFSGAE